MKKLILTICLVVGFMAVNAQNVKKATDKLPKQLAAQLNLTTDQKVKVDAILHAKASSLDSLNAIAPTDKSAKKVKRSINTEAEVKLDAVLTDDQKKVYADFKEARKAKNQVKKAEAGDMASPPAKP